MALRTTLYVDLYVPFENGLGVTGRGSISAVSQELMQLMSITKAGQFTGEEIRPAEVVFSFESKNLSTVLPMVRTFMENLGLLQESFLVVRKEMLPSESDLRVPLQDLDLWSKRVEQFARIRPKVMGRRPKVNDYYAVPLPDGRFGHLQYVYKDPMRGDFVQVSSMIAADRPCSTEDLREGHPMFPPVITAVAVGIRIGGWIFLGNAAPAEEFRFPTFRSTMSLLLRREESGVYTDWWLWSGGDNWQPVGRLGAEQRRLEYNVAWPPQDLARRIATGENEYDRYL